MERADLVEFPMQLAVDGTPFTVKTHPGTDFDEVSASWLIAQVATPEWLRENSQDGIVFLGVGESSQRGVFNEHFQRDTGGDTSECCATLVAKSLGIHEDPLYKSLLRYALGQDNAGKGSKFDLSSGLKAWRSLGRDNTEGVKWAHQGLRIWYLHAGNQPVRSDEANKIISEMTGGQFDVGGLSLAGGFGFQDWYEQSINLFVESEARTEAAIIWVKNNAEPHRLTMNGKSFTYWVLRSDDPFVTNAFRRLGLAAHLYVRIESDGHFQLFCPKYPQILESVFRRLIHRIYSKKRWIPDAILQESPLRQLEWVRNGLPKNEAPAWSMWLYIHPATGSIMNGSLTARPKPLIGDDFTVPDLIDVIDSVATRMTSTARRPRPTTTPTPAIPTSEPVVPVTPTDPPAAPVEPAPTN